MIYGKRQTWDRVDRYERIVVERIEAFHHYYGSEKFCPAFAGKTVWSVLGLRLWNCQHRSCCEMFQNVPLHLTLGVAALICIRK